MGVKLAVTVTILAAILPFLIVPTYYSNTVYQADIGKEWLWRARATNDLNDMANYLQKSLDQLESYNGNPKWLYPSPDTDYNLIKDNIRETIRNARTWSNQTGSSFAYQQAVSNLQETISEIANHIEIANTWLLQQPWIIFITFIWCWIYVPAYFINIKVKL